MLLLTLYACDLVGPGPDHRPAPHLDHTDHVDVVELDGVVSDNVAQAVQRGLEATLGAVRIDDPRFIRFVARSTQAHLELRPFFTTVEARHAEWAKVLELVRADGLPEVFAAVPYTLSQYTSTRTATNCQRGIWQLFPEEALRVQQVYDKPLAVRDCRLRGRDALWTPTSLTPPDVRQTPYLDPEAGCLIQSCAVDERTDLQRSTAGALVLLREAWNHPEVQHSGSAVQLTLTAVRVGTDDGHGGRSRRGNVLPALRAHLSKHPEAGKTIVGDNILCATADEPATCGSVFIAEGQHFAYTALAQHLAAVCYLGQAHADLPAFSPWAVHSEPGGYCEAFAIPTAATVSGWASP